MPHRHSPAFYHDPEIDFIPYLKSKYLGKGFSDPQQTAIDSQVWTERQKAVIERTLPTSEGKPTRYEFKRSKTKIFIQKNGKVTVRRNGQFVSKKVRQGYSKWINKLKEKKV